MRDRLDGGSSAMQTGRNEVVSRGGPNTKSLQPTPLTALRAIKGTPAARPRLSSVVDAAELFPLFIIITLYIKHNIRFVTHADRDAHGAVQIDSQRIEVAARRF